MQITKEDGEEKEDKTPKEETPKVDDKTPKDGETVTPVKPVEEDCDPSVKAVTGVCPPKATDCMNPADICMGHYECKKGCPCPTCKDEQVVEEDGRGWARRASSP